MDWWRKGVTREWIWRFSWRRGRSSLELSSFMMSAKMSNGRVSRLMVFEEGGGKVVSEGDSSLDDVVMFSC